MKNVKSRILLMFLSTLILFNSSGFGLVEHSCSMHSKKSYSFVTKKSCNGCEKHKAANNGTATISKTKCCNDKEPDKNSNVSESIVNHTVKILKSFTEVIYSTIIWATSMLIEVAISTLKNHHSESSLLSGKNLLIFISTFRL
jgi:hypothetical protein